MDGLELKLKHATEADIEAVATQIELLSNPYISESIARAAIAALEERGWQPPNPELVTRIAIPQSN